MAPKALAAFVVSTAAIAIADLWAKALIRQGLVLCSAPPVALCDRRTLFGPIGLLRIENGSSAFGLVGGDVLPTFVALAVGLVALEVRRLPISSIVVVGFGLQVGGLLGNVVDRLITGAVTDFLDIRWSAVGGVVANPGDLGLAVGGTILAIACCRAFGPAKAGVHQQRREI